MQDMAQERFVAGSNGLPADTPVTVLRTVDAREFRLPPTLDQVVRHVKSSVVQTAVGTSLLIKGKYGDLVFPFPTPMTEDFKIVLDNNAVDLMEASFDSADFEVNVPVCEGGKEGRKNKKKAVKILSGRHGRLGVGKLEVGVDVIEGTTVASLGQRGAISIAGGILTGELPFIPNEDGDAIYFDRVIAGPQLRGIEPGMKVKDMFEVARRNVGIIHPKQLEIVALNRPKRNGALMEQALEAGVTLTLIESGDLVPALFALQKIDTETTAPENRRVAISAGSGGKEEALLAFLAALSMGGIAWGSFQDGNGKPSEMFPGLKTLDWIKGDKKDSFVCVASITGTDPKWFGLKPVRPHVNGNPNGRVVNGFDITSVGIVPFTLFV